VRITRLEVGLLAANTYLVKDDETEAGAVIDPGAEGDRIAARCRQEGLRPQFIINTHGHVDHVGGDAALKRAFPEAALCIGSRDADMLRSTARELAALFGGRSDGPAADILLGEGRRLTFGACVLDVIETPGHTPGGVCLLAREETPQQLFCGDLVFRGDFGRFDLPGGSYEEIVESIRRKVLTLPDDTVLWPGHGDQTTVGEERRRGLPGELEGGP
jgi:glyoxylase-like metal-dependent hydrolase (beta-lactamase superfamily II)